MQVKYYALATTAAAVVAMGAHAQTSYPGATTIQVQPSVPATQSGVIVVPATTPTTIVVVEGPGVTRPATREEIRAETRSEMKAGHIPKGEQSTATQGTKPDYTGSEMMWHR